MRLAEFAPIAGRRSGAPYRSDFKVQQPFVDSHGETGARPLPTLTRRCRRGGYKAHCGRPSRALNRVPSANDHESAHVARRALAPTPGAKGRVPASTASQQRFTESRTDGQSADAPAKHESQVNELTPPYLATARTNLDENDLAEARAALT